MKTRTEKRLKHWYLLLITGAIFIGLGIWVMATPLVALITLAWIFSIGFVISGISEIVYSLSNRKELKNWGWYLAGGILTLIMGLHLMLRPGLTALILCFYIGFWLMFRSIMHISTAIELKDTKAKNWGWVLALGIIGVIFSFVLLWNPVVTSITVSYWMGFGLLAFGILQIVLSLGLRKIRKEAKEFREDLEGEYAEIIDQD